MALISNTTMDTISHEALQDKLKGHIVYLSEDLGPRNIEDKVHYEKLCRAAAYIDHEFKKIGYQTGIMKYSATYNHQVFDVQNIEVTIPSSIHASDGPGISDSTPSKYMVIGAHYDTVLLSPGADDNSSGIAALLEIARHMYNIADKTKIKHTIKLVAFANEECKYSLDPKTGKHFGSNMGSVQYAKQAKARGDVITGMISLESIGYFSSESNSQIYPWYMKWLKYFYGNRGDFLMMIGDLKSRSFQKRWMACYKQIDPKPLAMHPIALPGWIPNVYRSDHGSFSLEGFPACMITDTANFRNKHYHQPTDTIETIHLDYFTKATKDLMATVERLALSDELEA